LRARPIQNRENFRSFRPRLDYFAGAGAGAVGAGGDAAGGEPAVLPAVVGAGAGVAATAACGWAAGLIQQA